MWPEIKHPIKVWLSEAGKSKASEAMVQLQIDLKDTMTVQAGTFCHFSFA